MQLPVERNAQLLALIEEAFINFEVGVVLGHGIFAEMPLAFLVEPPADLPEGLNRVKQRCRILVGTLQRLCILLQC